MIFKPSENIVINFYRQNEKSQWKNLDFLHFPGTFIFIQQKKELEYNVIAYQAPQQPVLHRNYLDSHKRCNLTTAS